MLKRIKYVSRFAEGLPAGSLAELETLSARNNRERGLTGVLLTGGGLFFQVLEGEPEAVDEVYAAIARDPRHRDLLLLSEELAIHRLFPDWSMKAVAIDPERVAQLEPLHALLEAVLAERRLADHLAGTLERTVWSELQIGLARLGLGAPRGRCPGSGRRHAGPGENEEA